MDLKTYPLSVVSTLTGIKKSSLKRLGEQGLIDIRYSHDRLDASKAGYEIHSKTPSMDGRDKITSVMPILQTELTRFLTWLEEHPEIERDLNNDPVIGIDQLIKDAGYTQITILGMYQNGQINITGLARSHSKGIISGYVTRLEYERILDLARSQQSKPTYEQLEATISKLKAENEQLTKQLTQAKKPKADSERIQALTFWVEGKGKETVEQMERIDIRNELSRIDPIFKMSESSFINFWKVQKVIELKAGKRAKQG